MRSKRFIYFKTTVLASFLTLATAKAECTYDQFLKAEEFPIGVMLTWSTAAESNNSMFILEKSENGVDFATTGTVKGAGSAKAVKKYNFLDAQASNQKIYYRLKQVDFDGTYSYSEVMSFDKKYQTNLMLVQMASEMVSKSFDFTIDAVKEGGVVLQIIDGANVMVWQGTRMVSQGLNNLSVDMSGLRDGVYKVVMVMEKDQKTLTIRKAELELRNLAARKKGNKN
jgi:predicted ribosome-associated RNA-binding protein Tma20